MLRIQRTGAARASQRGAPGDGRLRLRRTGIAMVDAGLRAACQQGASAEASQSLDLSFIDAMIPHHEGAIAMAQQALEQAEHDELKQMAQEIISAQEAEIAQLQAWRTAWYPDAAPTAGMGMDMGTMEVAGGDQPFDLRFIDGKITALLQSNPKESQ